MQLPIVEAPAVLYNLTAAASCTSSGACAGETPLYSSGLLNPK